MLVCFTRTCLILSRFLCRRLSRRFPARRVALALALVCAAPFARALFAHDIPADTTVRAFIKPEGKQLHFLVRVQMASINDIDWPVHRTDGTLDLARVEPFL